jgi:hypothetical protein
LQKQTTDALAARRDSLRQAFFQALQQVQGNALARASFNQSADQFSQQMAAQQQANALSQSNANRSFAEGVREFNLNRKDAHAAAAASASAAGFTPNEVQTFRSDIYDAIATAKKGIPYMGAHNQLHKGGPGGPPRWRVPPAPLGAPHEPGQSNSIFAMYQFLSQRYDPHLQPLILAELQAAYPKATWKIFAQQMTGGGGVVGAQQRHR